MEGKVSIALKILKKYEKILNSKILNFYVENQWATLPGSWQTQLDQIQLDKLDYLLLESAKTSIVWPLSILAIKSLLHDINISRTLTQVPSCRSSAPLVLTHSKLQPYFKKHVKPKKKHEIEIMSRICSDITNAGKTVQHIVDFGSGLGHLSRLLQFGYNLQVCGIEQQMILIEQSKQIDKQVKEAFSKYSEHTNAGLPKYLNLKITEHTDAQCLVNLIKHAFGIEETDNFSCGFVGLHPCGDLGAILMHIFLKCPEIKFISFVGCCYMKLTMTSSFNYSDFRGYPLSQQVFRLPNSKLSYEALEIACHAIEKYTEQLTSAKSVGLKIHSYRAAIETIIAKRWPELKQSGLKSVKYLPTLTFQEYCEKAVSHLNISITVEDIDTKEIDKYLADWKRVIIFYTLRLFLAPLVESVILYDRILFLKEKGCECDIQAVFDPKLSPRNHVITAWKT